MNPELPVNLQDVVPSKEKYDKSLGYLESIINSLPIKAKRALVKQDLSKLDNNKLERLALATDSEFEQLARRESNTVKVMDDSVTIGNDEKGNAIARTITYQNDEKFREIMFRYAELRAHAQTIKEIEPKKELLN